MNRITSPLFCLTSDIDWASEYAIEDLLVIASRFGVRPTIFATHPSPVLQEYAGRGLVEIGIHPNFLPGSTHGSVPGDVIDHMCGLFPGGKCFRSHTFVDHSHITKELYRRGIRYDSNLCLDLQADPNPPPTAGSTATTAV